MNLLTYCLLVAYVTHTVLAAVSNTLETCQDEKGFKNMLKTRPNLLVLFSKSDVEVREVLKLLKEVNLVIKNTATIGYINCEKVKKVCKKYKINPNPYELKHYKDGVFNKDYDRQLVKKSLVTFLKDPTGDMPWEEEESAKDIVHVRGEAALMNHIKKVKQGVLVMFYAPWCGFCKKLKPDYSAAATELKRKGALVAVNCDLPENNALRNKFNITGYPTLSFFRDGSLAFQYGGEYNQKSIVEWMQDPQPPKEKEKEVSWSEDPELDAINFLGQDNFDHFLLKHQNVLVEFYAPWCGHCKTMKPIYGRVARKLREEGSENMIAFVDATESPKLAQKFKVKGYPTVKFFKDGKFAWDYDERDENKILEFMRNPVQPPAKEKEPEWKDEESLIIHAESQNFASVLKTKKHALVIFYAPWCGHCKLAKPHFKQAAEHFRDDPRVAFVAVDCTQHQSICEQYSVKGFPTLYYFNFGKNPIIYEGGREAHNFISYMQNWGSSNQQRVADPRDEWIGVPGQEHLFFLNDANFDQFVQTRRRVLIFFMAPWCGYCQSMKAGYALAAMDLANLMPGQAFLAVVDGTKPNAAMISQRYQITGYPTLKVFENGGMREDYTGIRSREEFVKLMRNGGQPLGNQRGGMYQQGRVDL